MQLHREDKKLSSKLTPWVESELLEASRDYKKAPGPWRPTVKPIR